MNIDFKTELLKDLFLGKAKGKQKFSQEVLTQYNMSNNKYYRLNSDEYPDETFHPGEYIRDELKARGIKQKEFAKKMDLHTSFVSELISGKRKVTPATALKLEKILGISAKFWVSMQADYDVESLRIKQRKISQKSRIRSEREVELEATI